ncbi:hypothetical protein [Nocardia sp. CC201C]|uniref:hypothetical protein n=1 Tax=Nocardia sp. CC201C TaxID=3044575 RepID=UPI0024A98083|nr:hypothetical protein [Nocardia sp. CC201C]
MRKTILLAGVALLGVTACGDRVELSTRHNSEAHASAYTVGDLCQGFLEFIQNELQVMDATWSPPEGHQEDSSIGFSGICKIGTTNYGASVANLQAWNPQLKTVREPDSEGYQRQEGYDDSHVWISDDNEFYVQVDEWIMDLYFRKNGPIETASGDLIFDENTKGKIVQYLDRTARDIGARRK